MLSNSGAIALSI